MSFEGLSVLCYKETRRYCATCYNIRHEVDRSSEINEALDPMAKRLEEDDAPPALPSFEELLGENNELKKETWHVALWNDVSEYLNQERERYGKEKLSLPIDAMHLLDSANLTRLCQSAYRDEEKIGGFVRIETGEIYIAAVDANDTFLDQLHSIIHEMVHRFSGDGLEELWGHNENEAMVERVALEILSKIVDSGVLFEEELDEETRQSVLGYLENSSYVEERRSMLTAWSRSPQPQEEEENFRRILFTGGNYKHIVASTG